MQGNLLGEGAWSDVKRTTKGDVEIALLLYRKALDINPNDADVIGAAAHFLATEGFAIEGLDPCVLFARSLKINPNNPDIK
jgi:hypothetical protein